MKTIICIFLVLATSLSLQAQFLSDESYSSYSDSFASSSQDFISANDLDFEMGASPIQPSPLSLSKDWLINLFGADYAPLSDDWHILPYSDTGVKIPAGNGTIILILSIGLYTIIILIRKKLRILRFALILP